MRSALRSAESVAVLDAALRVGKGKAPYSSLLLPRLLAVVAYVRAPMTDIVDTNAETRSAIEALLPTAIAELKEQIDNGGMRSIRIRCTSCGANINHELQVADADLLVKAVTALSSALPRMQSKDDAKGARVTRILSDFSELTSAELAEYIAQLEALNGQDDHPD